MGLYAELKILNDEEGHRTFHGRKFVGDILFDYEYYGEEEATLNKILTKDEYKVIRPIPYGDFDIELQNPNEFKTIILKIKKQLKIDNLYNEYKKDFKDILFVCDKAIELNKQIYFTYSN